MTQSSNDSDASALSGEWAESVGKLAMESLECERQRYESMLGTAGRMIASLSLVSVALATLVPGLFEGLPGYENLLLIELFLVFVLIITSSFFAVWALYRRAYDTLGRPQNLLNNAKKEASKAGPFVFASCEWMTIVLNDTVSGLKDLNNWIGKRLRVATVILMIDLGLILVFGLVDIFVYFSICR